tara:strand:- start:5285 stop:5713 length:429 start_codon:yes stop_codon:yes gene_type:complete
MGKGGIAQRQQQGLKVRKGGVAARKLAGTQSVSKRLRSTNNTVRDNSHGDRLQQIKAELLELNPVCGCNKYGRGQGCGKSLVRGVYFGTIYADHILPVSQGGATVYGNIQLLCYDCHVNKLGSRNRKGARLLKATGKSGRRP